MQRFFMAKKYDIDIDSYIGGWTCNKRAVKYYLNELGEKEVTVRVNSLGGDVDTAIDIASQFEAHGNITCDLYAFNASAATILTLGAKKVRMHENGMYLIHKAMVWVSEFGYMNEDSLSDLIEKLRNSKQDSAVITLNLASMYAKKSGKDIKDILNLMKQETWLDSKTAKEWGFVDEIFTGSISAKKQENVVEMLNCAELPIPENYKAKDPEQINSEEDILSASRKDFMGELVSSIKNIFTNNKNETETMSKKAIQAALVAAILNVEIIEAVNDKVEFSPEDLSKIENSISGLNEKIENLTKSVTEKENEISNLKKQVENKDSAPGDTTNAAKPNDDQSVDEDKIAYFDNSTIESAKNLFNMIP